MRKRNNFIPKANQERGLGKKSYAYLQLYVDTYVWQCRLVRKCVDKKRDVK
jgi:hypothetical protein